jgi:NADPH-dependent 2,4-dienoyl-CoA reductase/sulfur reductase-like enzyme
VIETDVGVVGAGPAGMAAALAAAECGLSVTVCDEYPRPGGQFFKRAGGVFALGGAHLGREHERGERLRRALAQGRIRVLSEALVWGAFPGNALMINHGGRSEVLRARAVVIATGAYDRPVPFPGWTLPGVITAGGAQTLAKTQWVKPGQRMLLAGAGPFVLPVAESLLRAGVDIVTIVEATRPREWWRHAAALRGQWERFAEAFAYWRRLRRARVPVLFGHKILRVEGDEAVGAAVVAPVDGDWRAGAGEERRFAVDAVATGYGFLPNLELADLLGCEARWDSHNQSWFVAVDERLATSRPGIFAAGEITGIGGSAIALEEGRIAGISAAEHLGALDAAGAVRLRAPSQRAHRRLQRFAAMVNALFAPRPGLWEGIAGDTLVCRCEEVTAADVRNCVREGCRTPKEVKDWTRAGMGLCQGRICRSLVAQAIAEERRVPAREVARPSVRPPIKPTPIGVLATTELP